MTGLARIFSDLITDKGEARPMLARGAMYRDSTHENVTWHPAAARRLALAMSRAAAKPAARATRGGSGDPDRVRASLRLKHELHERLKTLGSASGRTQQSILLQALEEYLERWPEDRAVNGDRRSPIPR
jgi:hypothetical protein